MVRLMAKVPKRNLILQSLLKKLVEAAAVANKKPMIKRKDGSYSQQGLWDNIRANKGSGKKPTPEMIKQEKKIKSKKKK